MAQTEDTLIIGGRKFTSRLMVGTGKYASFEQTARALEMSGAQIITVAVRRVNLDRSKESLLDYIDLKKYTLLPNTAGCYTADDAVRTCRLAREAGMSDFVK
ncbi:MAG: thiazole synthase, partial [Geobacteraceae bacterium]|nr:thiazole synthase [Geobacteraceae bacterium]